MRFWGSRSPSTKLLILLPEYDDLTRAMAAWAPELSGRHIVVLRGPNVNPDNVVRTIKAMQKGGVVVLFAGHGDFDALLTAPDLGLSAERYQRLHSVLMDAEVMKEIDCTWLFAYSCRSARDLGDFVSRRQGVFLGFSDLLPFPFAEGSDLKKKLDIHFKEPLLIVWRSAGQGRGLDLDTLDQLQKYYQDAIEKLKHGDRRKDPYSGLVRMALRQHLKLVTIKKGIEATLVN